MIATAASAVRHSDLIGGAATVLHFYPAAHGCWQEDHCYAFQDALPHGAYPRLVRKSCSLDVCTAAELDST